MGRRENLLHEMGFTPLWVERTRLAALQEQAALETPADNAAPTAPVAPAPTVTPIREHIAPLVAAVAEHAPAVAQTPAARPAPSIPIAIPGAAPTGRERTPAPVEAPAEDARSLEIGQMDWAALQQSVAACTACGLCQGRTNTVYGVGNPNADIMVIGEAPGQQEDLQGEPFVGAAGQLLDNMLNAIGEKRGERVYIANVLKCRPPGNRNPQPDEVAQCSPYLRRQVALVQPRVIFAVGRFAIQTLLQTDAPVSALRGKLHHYQGVPVVVSYHPAYLLRNLPDKAKAWRDLLLLKSVENGIPPKG
ncbi:DNA polymerase [Silvimonas terrae]|uniref:Type-4 uracil-DNA glycosylase n=1 Tax=Silvimonas terrae TaxID=300266 RepID=A0A840RLX1_9NEIS|nr:uracil-DNA glycosylase [Silvimonas terrae]MBB5193500.1 DNA polymerase [Silvimonas terrae]